MISNSFYTLNIANLHTVKYFYNQLLLNVNTKFFYQPTQYLLYACSVLNNVIMKDSKDVQNVALPYLDLRQQNFVSNSPNNPCQVTQLIKERQKLKRKESQMSFVEQSVLSYHCFLPVICNPLHTFLAPFNSGLLNSVPFAYTLIPPSDQGSIQTLG